MQTISNIQQATEGAAAYALYAKIKISASSIQAYFLALTLLVVYLFKIDFIYVLRPCVPNLAIEFYALTNYSA